MSCAVSPKSQWDFNNPIPSQSPQLLLQDGLYDLVNCFHLPIRLRMINDQENLSIPVIGTKILKVRAFELCPIIINYFVGNPVTADDVLYHKDDHFCQSDHRHRLGFYPFGEVINCDYYVLCSSSGHW